MPSELAPIYMSGPEAVLRTAPFASARHSAGGPKGAGRQTPPPILRGPCSSIRSPASCGNKGPRGYSKAYSQYPTDPTVARSQRATRRHQLPPCPGSKHPDMHAQSACTSEPTNTRPLIQLPHPQQPHIQPPPPCLRTRAGPSSSPPRATRVPALEEPVKRGRGASWRRDLSTPTPRT